MRRISFIAVPALLLFFATAPISASAAEPAANWDGLVEVSSKRMDAAFLMPGADFRSYKKVMLDQPQVAFRKDWMRNMNSTTRVSGRVTESDAKKILETVQSNTLDIFTEAFTKAGYQVVTEAGEDVLRVGSGVINLYVNAPDVMTAGRSRSYTTYAGEATLVLELRDSLTNALIGRVLDRRETQNMPGVSNSVTNLADYRALARQWAGISVKGLERLKAYSPIPDPLVPGQKLE